MTTIAVSVGDPQGIGPEVTVRVLREEPGGMRWLVYGPASRLAGLEDAPNVEVRDTPYEADGAPPPSAEAGRAALAALDGATEAVLAGEAKALVTAPLSKEAVALVHPGFTGHTGWLGERTGTEPLMMLASGTMRVFLATDHVPLARVSEALTAERLERVLVRAREGLRTLYGIPEPRIAVLGLNPHAGEGGELGREELEVIGPVLAGLGGRGAGFIGPISADSFFAGAHESFDGIVAMYHDQGLIPLKAASFGGAVNVSVGLPFLRISPDHGTAHDIAGRGRADPSSMRAAVAQARAWVETGRLTS